MQETLNFFPSIPKLLQNAYYSVFPGPKNLIVHIGNECNYDCIYCYNNRKITEKELVTDEWIKIMDVAAKMGIETIGFSGGEPFLHPDFFFLISYAAKKFSNITIFTNGSLINEDWIRQIKKLNSNIQIVIKFDSPLVYGKHTGRPEMFQKMKDGINICLRENFSIVAFITLTKYNMGHLEDMIKSAVDIGVYPFIERFNPVEDPQTNKDLEIDDKDWEKALRLSMKLYSGYNYYTYLEKSLIPLKGSSCGCFTNLISITSDGFVLPCPFFPVKDSLGNIKEKSLKNIWKEYSKKRKNWLKTPEECDICENKNVCDGGCKTHTYLKYGTTDKKDPLCTGKIPPTYCHIAFLAASLKKGLK